MKDSIITCIELHVCFLVIQVLLYAKMRTSFIRNGKRQERSLTVVYIGSALMLASDCVWTVASGIGNPGNAFAYIINLLYFISSCSAAAYWFIFCNKHLETKLSDKKIMQWILLIPYAAVMILYILSPVCGLIFSIQDGAYVRGSLFFFDPLIKMLYIIFSSSLAVISASHKNLKYQKRSDFSFVLFGIPVIVCGILQTITGVDFNCLGVTFGLIMIYIVGITDSDSENTDVIYSLANSFQASYIVNMHTGLIRPLREDIMHGNDFPEMSSKDYMTHFQGILSKILLDEDRERTLDTFNLENVIQRFKIDNSFNIRYRTKESSGQTAIHMASFIRAAGEEGKQEFLLGINTIQTDSLLYERNESLSHENQRLEQINTSIIESVAKIVEVRDGGSGEHIVRVRRLTELIAKEVMIEFPEFKLDDETVKLISSASVLHDIGKIVIPDAVLLKPGRLTEEEFSIMKTHSAKGCDMLNLFPLGLDDAFLEYALSICRWHHEKYDGKGYPDGLKGDNIPIAAQIVSVADCFDALVSDRPYKKAFPPEEAVEMILRGDCGAFSPKILSAFVNQKDKLTELARLYK